MNLTNTSDDQDWKETDFNGKIINRREICSMLDRAFRCGHSYSGSPLEYYGPIPRKLSKGETKRAIRDIRKKRLQS